MNILKDNSKLETNNKGDKVSDWLFLPPFDTFLIPLLIPVAVVALFLLENIYLFSLASLILAWTFYVKLRQEQRKGVAKWLLVLEVIFSIAIYIFLVVTLYQMGSHFREGGI